MSKAHELLSAPLGLQLLDLVSELRAASLTDDDLSELVSEARSAVSIYHQAYDEHVALLRSRAGQLESAAAWLVTRVPHWWADIDRAAQVWVGPAAEPPTPKSLVVNLSPYSAVVSKPKQVFWTSTETASSWSPWLDWLRFGEDQRPGPYHLWRLTPLASARVVEIHSPADWSALVRANPSTGPAFRDTGTQQPPRGSARSDPDWSKVAEGWDGIHVSVGGLLTAEDLPFKAGGATTELRGWDMESTAWFRWSFSAIEPVIRLDR